MGRWTDGKINRKMTKESEKQKERKKIKIERQ